MNKTCICNGESVSNRTPFLPPEQWDSLLKQQVNSNPFLHNSIYHHGSHMELVISQLSMMCADLQKDIIRLQSIAPRKYRLPDGRVVVWHCPDEFLEEEKLDAPPHANHSLPEVPERAAMPGASE
jgi:hypothetical protein